MACSNCGGDGVFKDCWKCYKEPEKVVVGGTMSYFTPKGNKRRYKEFTSVASAKKWMDRMYAKGYGNFIWTEHTVTVGLNWNRGRPAKPLSQKEWDKQVLSNPNNMLNQLGPNELAKIFPRAPEDSARHMWHDPIEMKKYNEQMARLAR